MNSGLATARPQLTLDIPEQTQWVVTPAIGVGAPILGRARGRSGGYVAQDHLLKLLALRGADDEAERLGANPCRRRRLSRQSPHASTTIAVPFGRQNADRPKVAYVPPLASRPPASAGCREADPPNGSKGPKSPAVRPGEMRHEPTFGQCRKADLDYEDRSHSRCRSASTVDVAFASYLASSSFGLGFCWPHPEPCRHAIRDRSLGPFRRAIAHDRKT